jgi:phosphatidylglycerol:prolipoprotein diacylglycerol transferase
VFFYGLASFLENPLFLFKINQGGMSFHGGLLGVMLASGWFAHRTHRTFWQVADFVAPLATIGLGLGRIGNFIGGELWGRVSDVPWAMIFPNSIQSGGWSSLELREAWMRGSLDSFARHPSQLYQAVLEGLVLYALLAWYSRVPRPVGMVAGLFLVAYGCFRIAVEFFREPDGQIGFLAGGWLTMGMLLSVPMILLGIAVILMACWRERGLGERSQGGRKSR